MQRQRPIQVCRQDQDARAGLGLCDFPDCEASGEFKAPKSRASDDGHYWFCLDHVRAYNLAWDYFAGMSRAEIERFQHEVATWHRPTWPFGAHPSVATVDDPFDILAGGPADRRTNGNGAETGRPAATPAERQALQALDLDSMPSLKHIKSRYKQLVKRYHPDANGGDNAAEERLKQINQAYEFLMNCGYYR